VDSLARGIRLLVGLGMVAAGTALAAPTALQVVAWWQARAADPGARSASFPFAAVSDGGPSHVPVPPPLAPVAGGMQLEYVPPPAPPEPLPPASPAFAAAAPDLGAAYRSALQAPPPPLLDGQAPPPLAVGWTGRNPASRPAPAAAPAAEPSAVYVVRDGDDLTGLATRFYGHPAAAAAIWQANHALLRDPRLLPIGMTLVLPPPTQVAALVRSADQAAIEPATERAVAPSAATPNNYSPWLLAEPLSGAGRPSP